MTIKKTTLESPPGVDLLIEQPKKGYRYNQDPFHLFRFVRSRLEKGICAPAGEALDLGTGVGILPLLLARALPGLNFTGLEIQSDLADLAAANVKRNHLADRIRIITDDYRETAKRHEFQNRFEFIVCNPPYYPAAAGRLNQCPQKRLARHEIAGDLDELLAAVSRFLKNRGTFFLIFPAERLSELFTKLQRVQLEPKELLFLHPRDSDRAATLLLAARRYGSPGITVGNPILI